MPGTRTHRTTVLAAAALTAVAAVAAVAAGPAEAAQRQPGDRLYPLARSGVPFCPAREVTARAPRWIALGCRGLGSARLRLVKRPLHGRLGRIDQRLDRVRYRPRDGFAGNDRFVVVLHRGQRSWRRVVHIGVPRRSMSARDTPTCATRHLVARFRERPRVRIVCRGRRLEALQVVAGSSRGRLVAVRRSGTPRRRTLVARLRLPASFVGQDVVVVRARNRFGTDHGAVSVSAVPWRMRALGDSVTAGFGYYANGGLMSVVDLLDCKPAAVVSNRCSSNSDEGPDYAGPPEWSKDFGLGNDVSWAAQFANNLQGGGHVTAPDMFQNRAVTGSAPSDWLPGGILNDQLKAIVAENPELIAFTMGANPLLTDILLTTAGEECSFTESVAALEACIAPFFAQVQLTARLQAFYIALLKTADSTLVTFQYSLSVPSANLFDAWQLEAMTAYFNAQIATAVTNTRTALPKQAGRLILIEAQTAPGTPTAQQLPRFNLGLPPDGQTWTPPYDCGDDDFVDGRSHQSTPTQDEFEVEDPFTYCEGREWIIAADSGIHPNQNGYARFASTLGSVAAANDLVPPLP